MPRPTGRDDEFAAAILEIAAGSGLLPYSNELHRAGRGDLVGEIQRRGGHIAVAAQLDLGDWGQRDYLRYGTLPGDLPPQARWVPVSALAALREWLRAPGEPHCALDASEWDALERSLLDHGPRSVLTIDVTPAGHAHIGEGNTRIAVALRHRDRLPALPAVCRVTDLEPNNPDLRPVRLHAPGPGVSSRFAPDLIGLPVVPGPGGR